MEERLREYSVRNVKVFGQLLNTRKLKLLLNVRYWIFFYSTLDVGSSMLDVHLLSQ